MNFFSIDSKFYKVMMVVGEMMILNFCWILASLPLVTIGAANTAMYAVMGQRLRKENPGTVKPFFKAFWSNLLPATPFWLAQALITFSLGLILFLTLPVFLKVIAAVLLILVTAVFSILYPQIARFKNRWFPYLRNAIILLVTRLRYVLLNLLLLLIPGILFLISPIDFLRFGFVWLLIGFSGMFYFSAEIMQDVLQPLEELSAKR